MVCDLMTILSSRPKQPLLRVYVRSRGNRNTIYFLNFSKEKALD
jgi:hypothetical protein